MEVGIKQVRPILVVLALLCALVIVPRHSSAEDVKAEGSYVLFSNGDATVSIRLIPSMKIYQTIHQNFSNPYLILRGFASSRADWEVKDKKADWDDSKHAVDFSMKMLGAAKNFGDHWELEIPKEASFINLDEAKKTFYFNESAPMGPSAEIRGTSKLVMPADATKLRWDDSRHVVTYKMPDRGGPSSRNMVFLFASLLLAIGGAAMTAVSFRLKT